MDARSRFISALRALALPGCRVLVAVSGGADSVALTRLFADVAGELSLTLFAAHMEHGIRGEASRADCAFVEALCAALGIPLTVRHADIPAAARESGEGLETCARRLRRAFLEETRLALGADVIALAHHENDQAETVLMHLLRGGGLSGAGAMRPISGHIVRPLLGFSRAEIEDYLRDLGQPYRTDATNAVCDNPRNALRHQVFPPLTAIYPAAAHALRRYAAIAADEDECLGELTAEIWQKNVEQYAGIFIIHGASALHPAILRRLIRRALPAIGFEDVERARLATGHSELAGGARSWRMNDALYLIPPLAVPAPVDVPTEGECLLTGIAKLTVAPCPPVPVKGDPFCQVVPLSVLDGACLRTRREGDYIRPFGLKGQKKSFSDFLTDRKFPYPLRARLPVIAREAEILWAPGAGVSEACRVGGGTEARKLTIIINT